MSLTGIRFLLFLWMIHQPSLDALLFGSIDTPIDEPMQVIRDHRGYVLFHGKLVLTSLSVGVSASARNEPSSRPRNCSRARESRNITVPKGSPSTLATSLYDISSKPITRLITLKSPLPLSLSAAARGGQLAAQGPLQTLLLPP